MTTPTEQTSSQSPWRRRIIAIAFVLFPMLVAGGVLAPQVVSLMAEDEAAAAAEPVLLETPSLDFSQQFPGKPPLGLERDPKTGSIPELLDLQHLFTDWGNPADLTAPDHPRLLGFPRTYGDVIVMDDVDRQIQDVVFKDPVMVGAFSDTMPPPNADLLALGDSRPFGDGLRFDDPQGTGEGEISPVPEPGAAALLLSGLACLGLRSRRRS